ncbi:hypothetical protein PRIPAC_81188 [Pristionchus pacificus]|uniref:Uncharacterized protein n=1 Tax=Pristionchus pacificus TaxID=54126 RepID=A0A2A6C333_PRIPA|nr:hypothetical protein PRIPAC_81188 [Pristionchus pacificus]|eukprot:PDM72584.1 hypothetical protein PRIPAC_39018 [Pristionchus pacificus]
MLKLPLWEPYVELMLSVCILFWLLFLFFLIITSQLHCVIRALLCSNTTALIIVALGQLSLALWCIIGKKLIGKDEFHFFAPIMLYQSGYYMCACSFLLITNERLLLCYKPNLYDSHHFSFKRALIVAITVELLMVIPVIIIMQYESLSILCATFVGVQEWVTFTVKGVIELIRAFIPIITGALCVKTFMLILTILSNKFENFAPDAHFLLRAVCTLYSIFMPFLLIFLVKTLRRRFSTIFPKCAIHPQANYELSNAQTATDKYFHDNRARSLNIHNRLGILPSLYHYYLSTALCESVCEFLTSHVKCNGRNRALLCTNTISVLLVAAGQFSISVWCIRENRLIGASQFHFFVPIIVHQTGYYMCACTFLLITSERLLLCYKPNFYDLHNITFTSALFLSLAVELLMTVPVIIAMQYESLNVFCATLVGLQEFASFTFLINCYRKSSLYYRTKFATVNLNSRFQVKCVIEVTKAFIPIITSALSVKGFVLILTILSIEKGDDFAVDANLLLRVACTSYSIIMPFLLIFRVNTLRRRFTSLLPSFTTPIVFAHTRETEDTQTATKKYFEELKKQWQ